MTTKVSLARYLFTRLRQLGVNTVQGVPGGLSLRALDDFGPSGLKFIGNCNELNAAYAADGYARIKGLSALFTSYGVGELSAINGVAMAYAEFTPVVHIVSTPARHLQNSRAIVQHSLGDGNMRVFAEIHAKVTAAQANLIDPDTAPALCDRTLQQCVRQSRPVYLELPSDMASAKVPASGLERPLDVTPLSNNQDQEDVGIELVLERMYSSKKPMILVDGLAARYDIKAEINELVRVTGFPTKTLPFGNSLVNNNWKNYHGVHAGKFGKLDDSSYTKSSDLILLFGPLLSDANTLGYSTVPDPRITITFRGSSISTDTSSHELQLKSFMRALLSRINQSKFSFSKPSPPLSSPLALLKSLPPTNPASLITQETLWLRLSSFFRPGDTILLANGTPWIGGRDFLLPPQTTLITSGVYLSIGQMLPSALGVALAKRDLHLPRKAKSLPGRTILFEGDGSFQTTTQELSTIIRHRLDVTIFLINNGGYTFERMIHGMDEEYNDIAPWRYLEAPRFFGAPEDGSYAVETRKVRTWGELEEVLRDERFGDGKGLKIVEVVVGRDDVPERFREALTAAGRELMRETD